MNRIDRLMGTMLLLQSRRVTRAEDIAEHFEISLRTVYRDVAALSEIGIPVIAEAGVGYSLMKGYLLPPIMFSEDEAAALGMAAMSLSRTSDPSLDASIQSALLKVKAALPERQRARLERVEESVVFGWDSYADKPEGKIASLVDLQKCLAEQRALRITYKTGGRGEVTTREVEPLGLIHYLDYWHVIAWCRLRQDYRDFRLDRIQKLDFLDVEVRRPSGFDLQQYLKSQRTEEVSLEVKVFFDSYALCRAKREWSLGLVAEEELAGGAILTLSTGDYDWMTGWLLSFREKARVIEPQTMRDLLVEEARRLAMHHAGGGSV
ncbi:helix-turn-helix transcriptional regulator [Pelagicoccus mobilis]|uniref:YafY family transcriptional regulator n=1 Tax=Pelagicoccus mobilis TaxID=415221 RepID=A0A934RYV3_9BACT|nr:YafY family protein [Pelagicoccus mobilis]MBK1879257.1 YafY family transcriptional regulator [Pelagicoccus mobilis]